jgi:octaprenyl-diphosphate synthase
LTNISLSKISSPIETELKVFEDLFKKSMKSKVSLVDLISRYILKQKGKKIRPVLVLLSSSICGGINERSYRGAALVELLHTATLIHDDVVDSSETRRGLPSINAIWKNKVGVLMGDYLLSRGLMLAVDGNDFDFLRVITNTVKRMSEGELLQISQTRKLNIDEETYFRIISDKTASLLATCCEIGARAATEDESKINAMREFGENLGIAFQIRDDILDYIGTKKLIGKPLGGDIKEKKITLPLIHALKSADKTESKRIIGLIKNGSKKVDVNEIINFTQNYNGIVYADNTAKEYSNKAIDNLKLFDSCDSHNSLEDLAKFIVERQN